MARRWPWQSRQQQPEPAAAAAPSPAQRETDVAPTSPVPTVPAPTTAVALARPAASAEDRAELREGVGSGAIDMQSMLVLGAGGGLSEMAVSLRESLATTDRVDSGSVSAEVMRAFESPLSAPGEDFGNLASTLPSLMSFSDPDAIIEGRDVAQPLGKRAPAAAAFEPGMATLAGLEKFVPQSGGSAAAGSVPPVRRQAGPPAAAEGALQRAMSQLEPFRSPRSADDQPATPAAARRPPPALPIDGPTTARPREVRRLSDAVSHESANLPPIPEGAPVVARLVPTESLSGPAAAGPSAPAAQRSPAPAAAPPTASTPPTPTPTSSAPTASEPTVRPPAPPPPPATAHASSGTESPAPGAIEAAATGSPSLRSVTVPEDAITPSREAETPLVMRRTEPTADTEPSPTAASESAAADQIASRPASPSSPAIGASTAALGGVRSVPRYPSNAGRSGGRTPGRVADADGRTQRDASRSRAAGARRQHSRGSGASAAVIRLPRDARSADAICGRVSNTDTRRGGPTGARARRGAGRRQHWP